MGATGFERERERLVLTPRRGAGLGRRVASVERRGRFTVVEPLFERGPQATLARGPGGRGGGLALVGFGARGGPPRGWRPGGGGAPGCCARAAGRRAPATWWTPCSGTAALAVALGAR